MDTATLTLLERYNSQTNDQMNRFLSTLTAEQWEKPLGGFFPSVKSLVNHLYIADFNWLKRFSRLKTFAYAQDPIFQTTIAFTETPVPTLAEYLVKRREMDQRILALVKEVQAEDLGRNLAYVDSHGNQYERNFGGLVLHFFNHQTHHRAMVSLYLEQMGISNDFANLMNLV